MKTKKIEEGTLSNSLDGNLDPCYYHLEKCVPDCFKKMIECNMIHSCWPSLEEGFMEEDVVIEEDGDEEDDDLSELDYCKGSNGLVKFFSQKCVVCLERDSDYVFKQCGHQCVCEECYRNKGDIDILKCVVCRT